MKDLVCKLIRNNPIERLSAREALKHPWFDMELASSNLESAQLNMIVRRESKIYRPEEFLLNERIQMWQIDNELLRYGFDFDSPTVQNKIRSLKSQDDFWEVLNKMNTVAADDFTQKRKREKTFALGSKRPNLDESSTETSQHNSS